MRQRQEFATECNGLPRFRWCEGTADVGAVARGHRATLMPAKPAHSAVTV